MSIVSLFVPKALCLCSFFVTILSVLLIVPVRFVWSSTFVSLGATFMIIVSSFISGLLYLYPSMVIDLPVPSVIPVRFFWGFASVGFSDGLFGIVVFDSLDILSREVLPRAGGLTWCAFMLCRPWGRGVVHVFHGRCSPSLARHLLCADLNIMFLTQLTSEQSWVSRACIITLLLRCSALLCVGLLSFGATAFTTIRVNAAPIGPRPGRRFHSLAVWLWCLVVAVPAAFLVAVVVVVLVARGGWR